jgi:hypothetical protein
MLALMNPQGDFPSVDEVRKAALVILPGSTYSPTGDDDWVLNLVQLLPQYVATGRSNICAL